MRSILLSSLLISVCSVQAQNSLEDLFVNQEWVIENLSDPRVILLHVGTEEDYNTGHIEGARLITPGEFSRTVDNLRWELPEEGAFSRALAERGVTDSTRNIIYFGNPTLAQAFRLYFTMKYFGLGTHTYILDGGLPGWYSRKQPVTSTREGLIPNPPLLTLQANPDMVVNKDQVMLVSNDSLVGIIDARRPDFFTGKTDGEGYYIRSGHIPGAVNITWLDLFDKNKFLKSPDEIRRLFEPINNKGTIITYCHVGLRATVLYSISCALGYETRLYDGSFTEWDKLGEQFPVQKGN